MAQQSRKDKNAWDRLMTYVHENQKVLWVILLIVIAPSFAMTNLFTNFIQPSQDRRVVRTIGGKGITGAEFIRTKEAMDHVLGILNTARMADFTGELHGALADATLSLSGPDAGEYYFLYREEARKRGIVVSDSELAEYIRDIWQRCEAVSRAAKEIEQKPLPPSQDQNARFQRQIEIISTGKKKLDDLRAGDGKAFDQESWVALIEGREGKSRRMIVRDFEETLRDIIAIAKLESFVKSTAKVTPQETFERYNKDNQERKVSWVEFKAPDAVKEKVKAGLTEDEVKNHYELTKESFKKGVSLKAGWLLLPKEHFKAEAEKQATDDELKKYYGENRNEYKKPTILAAEARFAVRTAAESEALRKELYKPFEDVKDKVRERFIEQRTKSDMQLLASQLSARIFPQKAPGSPPGTPDKPGASFDDLAKEYPFLKAGASAFFTRDEEKTALGEGFSTEVDRWWSFATQGKPIIAPRRAIEGEAGQVFYSKIETRPGNYLGLLKEIDKEVRDSLATRKVLDALKVAADAAVKDVNDGKKDLAALATSGLDVDVAGEKVHVAGAGVEAASEFIRKNGSLMVPRMDEKKDDKAKKKDADLDEEDREPDKEVHHASKEIVEAAYLLQDNDRGRAAVALDAKSPTCYVIRLDEIKLPNPARFEEHRKSVESEILREKEQSAFVKWRNSLNAEAAAN